MKYWKLFILVCTTLLWSVNVKSQCLVSSTLNVLPPVPPSGIWESPTTADICFEIVSYNNVGSNWLHGVSYTFGPGWDVATLLPTVFPTSCDGNGVWDWYLSVTSVATGLTAGPGFFYDSPAGGPGVLDGIPGNNFGDNCTVGAGNWVYCVQITTLTGPDCVDGADLSFQIDVHSDGETGSWGNTDCVFEPAITFAGPALSCCEAPIIETTDPSCSGDSDGTITAIGNSSGPYSFIWTTGLTETVADTSFESGLSAGLYTITMTDSAGCNTSTDVELYDPPVIDLLLDTVINVACPAGSNGTVTVSATGGTGPIQYAIDGGLPQVSGTFTSLSAGTYTLSAIDSTGCVVDLSVDVIEENVLTLAQDAIMDAICFGNADGSITVSATGGYAPYTFAIDSSAFGASSVFSGLAAGDYTLSVMDADGCIVTLDLTVGEPDELIVEAGEYTPIATGGSVVLTPGSNATSIGSWSWVPPIGLSCTTCDNPVASPESTTVYWVTLVDGSGCVAYDSTEVVVSLTIVIPNAFTPNGDGLNDYFTISSPYVDILELRVMDRWGEDVYVSQHPFPGWDGTKDGVQQELGTYIYTYRIVTQDGKKLEGSGTINLLR